MIFSVLVAVGIGIITVQTMSAPVMLVDPPLLTQSISPIQMMQGARALPVETSDAM
jgi:hypothetical protein